MERRASGILWSSSARDRQYLVVVIRMVDSVFFIEQSVTSWGYSIYIYKLCIQEFYL